MIPYNSILQLVDGRIYSLHHIWSSFHIHQPDFEALRFYGVSPADSQVIVAHTEGDTFIYKDLPAEMIKDLDEQQNIESTLAKIIGGNYQKEACHFSITEVSLQEVVDTFCRMQDHIAMTNGFWATDRPELFKGQPHYELLFPLKFRDET